MKLLINRERKIIKKKIPSKYWCVLVFLLCIISCDTGTKYEGDGDLDSGLLIYPTFRVIFPDISLAKNHKETYHFKHVPQADLILRLVLSKSDGKIKLSHEEVDKLFKNLTNSNVKIKTDLMSDGSLLRSTNLGELIRNWKLAAYGDVWYFWNKKYIDLKLNPEIRYELIIEIESSSESASEIKLIPILEGGGFGKGEIYRPV